MDEQAIIEEIISDIEDELMEASPGNNYYTLEGKMIQVDSSVIRDWFDQYQDVMRSRYLGE